MTNRILFFSLSLVFTAFSAAAQQEVADSQFWLDYNTSIKLDDRWSVGGDVAARGQVSNADWYQIVARPGVQYRVNNWLAPAAGVGLFSTFNQYQEDVNELRFYQDLSMHVHTLPLVDPLGRLRLEERFMVYEVSASEWIVRARLLVGLQTKDIPIGTQAFFLQGLRKDSGRFQETDLGKPLSISLGSMLRSAIGLPKVGAMNCTTSGSEHVAVQMKH